MCAGGVEVDGALGVAVDVCAGGVEGYVCTGVLRGMSVLGC